MEDVLYANTMPGWRVEEIGRSSIILGEFMEFYSASDESENTGMRIWPVTQSTTHLGIRGGPRSRVRALARGMAARA